MKKLLLTMLTLCLALGHAFAQDAAVYVSQDVLKAKQGGQATLSISMQNAIEINSWNFYLVLPEGMTYNSHKLSRDNGHTFNLMNTASGDLMFSCYSFDKAFTGNDGEIISIVLDVAADMPLGDAEIKLTNVNFSDMDFNSVLQDDYSIPVNVYTTYNISAVSANTEMGTVELVGGGEETENGTTVTATATSMEGYEFVNWTSGDAVVSTDNPYTFTATADLALVGNFKARKYDVTFDVDGVKTTESLDYGTVITKPEDPTKEGYTFAGWDPEFVEGTTVPVGGITYTATWTVNSHTITFNTNGGSEIAPMTLDYGTTIVLPDAPTREGYEFAGWAEEVPETMPDRDLVLNAQWNILQYTVKFVVDDAVVYEEALDYGTVIVAPADPEKEGYTFAGWDPEFVEGTTVPVDGITYTATWTVNNYTVTFKWNDVVYSTATVAYGSAITAPEAPEREGYTFTGWTPEVPEVMPAKDMTFEATWDVLQYTVKFVVDDAVVYEEALDYGTVIVAPADPEKEGYTFAGWDPEFVEGTTVPVGGITYNATWTVNNYTVTFKWNDVVYSTATVAYGSAITAPESPEREGYTFTGWTPEVPEVMPAKDMTFEATWDVLQYTVKFVVDDAVVYEEALDYGTVIVAPADPEKEGYTFAGWDPEFVEGTTVPVGGITYTATWTVNNYTVTFKWNDVVYSTATVAYGSAITAPESPEREGYTFAGWTPEVPEVMPAKDMTFEATWDVCYYEVSFVVDGVVVQSEYMAYGSEIVAPEVAEKEGYTFTGWSPELLQYVPSYNVVFTAQFEVNVYTLTYYLDDEVVYSTELEYGAPVEEYTPEVEEGRKFDGWQEEIPEFMPAHDVEIHGTTSEIPSGIAAIVAELGNNVDVYNLQGRLVVKNADAKRVNQLPVGIYIINGKKYIKK